MELNKKIFSVIILVGLLSSCTKGLIDVQEETKTKEINLKNFKSNIDKSKKIFTDKEMSSENFVKLEENSDKKLDVNYKCIGCNKCIMIAPDNFRMDWDNRVAVVISQKGLKSDRVNAAIERCPVDAIDRI